LWADHVVIEAGELLSCFNADDWAEAQAHWNERDVIWQERFADVLVDGNPERTVPMLVKIIEQTPHDSVALIAADSLRTVLKKSLGVSPTAIARIRYLQSKSTGLMRDSLNKLIERVHEEPTI